MLLKNGRIVLLVILALVTVGLKCFTASASVVDPSLAYNCKTINCSFPTLAVTNDDQLTQSFIQMIKNAIPMTDKGIPQNLSNTEWTYITCNPSNDGYQSCWFNGSSQFKPTTDYRQASPNINMLARDKNNNLMLDSDGSQLYCPLTRCDVVTDDILLSFQYNGQVYNIDAALNGKVVGSLQNVFPFLNGWGLGDMMAMEIGNPNQSNVQNISYKGICLAINTPVGYVNFFCKNPNPPVSSGSPSCTAGVSNNSKAFFSISGRVIECVRTTLSSVFSTTGQQGQLSIFQLFQNAMQGIVQAALILYVVLYGIHIAVGRETPNKGEVLTFFFKMLLVVYFSVGLEIGGHNSSGTVQYLYPLLTGAMDSFSQYVFGAANNQICNYPSIGTGPYAQGYSYLALWDAVDCRVGYYLGLYSITTPTPQAIFGILSLIFPALFAMEFIFIIFMICFGVFLLSIVVYFVNVFIMALIGLTIMAYLAPVFVPCALFTQTKSYFDAWVKLMLSYTLQPVIITAFLAIMLSVFDHIIYADCKFDEVSGGGGFQYWVLQNQATQTTSCQSSFGYQLNSNNNIDSIDLIFISVSIFNVDEGGALFHGLVQAMLFVFIFFFFAQSLGHFAAELTGGNSLSEMAIKPTQIAEDVAKKVKDKMASKTKAKGAEGVDAKEAGGKDGGKARAGGA